MIPPRYPVSRPYLGRHESHYVFEALVAGQLSQGPRVLQFERDFAKWVGADHAVAVMNGTVALHLALATVGVGPGDEVIVPATTYVATANAVTYCGARPVIVDVDEATWCLDPAATRRAITKRTRAIVPVHLYGQPAEMRALDGICHDALEQFGYCRPALIADAAQAHGARSGAYDVSWLADLSTYSFYGNKILTTGEGGMIVTNIAVFAERLRFLRGQAMDAERRYWHTEVGYNYRMTELQGALGCAQVEDADAHVAARRLIGQWYREYTAALPVTWQQANALHDVSSYWLMTCLLPEGVDRDQVAASLYDEGIETRPAFPPLYQFPMYRVRKPGGAATEDVPAYHTDAHFPHAASIGARGISLPTYRGLTEADVEAICAALGYALGKAGA